jgi:hypothetical protein
VDDSAGIARPLPGLRLLFAGGTLLVVLAGLQLFVFSERTDEYFAWTIASPLTAAVDGAFFLTAIFLFAPATRAETWAEVRPLAYAVVVVATTKLIATLLNLDPFHFEGPGTAAQIAAWGWLVVYIAVPIALVGLIVAQHRAGGSDPPPGRPLPAPLRAAFSLLAVTMIAIGALLLLAADAAADIWPWALTPLTSHALSAWFLGLGVLAALNVREDDLLRSRSALTGAAALAVLLTIAVARYESEVDWGEPMAWVLAALVALLACTGVGGLVASRRA